MKICENCDRKNPNRLSVCGWCKTPLPETAVTSRRLRAAHSSPVQTTSEPEVVRALRQETQAASASGRRTDVECSARIVPADRPGRQVFLVKRWKFVGHEDCRIVITSSSWTLHGDDDRQIAEIPSDRVYSSVRLAKAIVGCRVDFLAEKVAISPDDFAHIEAAWLAAPRPAFNPGLYAFNVLLAAVLLANGAAHLVERGASGAVLFLGMLGMMFLGIAQTGLNSSRRAGTWLLTFVLSLVVYSVIKGPR